MNRRRLHFASATGGLLVFASLVSLLAVAVGASLFADVSPAFADAPTGTVSAAISGTTVSLSGSWNFPACEQENKKKVVGFGVFIDGNTPIAGPSLDSQMHFAIPFGSNPCTNTPGTWSDSHTLAPGSHQVCVVFYDPHVGEFDETGDHSLILAGPDRNNDNSFEKNGDAFPQGTCLNIAVPSPAPAQAAPPSPPVIAPQAQAAAAAPAAAGVPQALPNGGGEPANGVAALGDPAIVLAVLALTLIVGLATAGSLLRLRADAQLSGQPSLFWRRGSSSVWQLSRRND